MKRVIMRSIWAGVVTSGLLLAAPYSARAQDPSRAPSKKEDSELAAKVRRAITEDKSLPSSAHNVRVTSQDGNVVIRGRVNSTEEKESILAKAREAAGSANVKDEITVSKTKKDQ